MSSLSGFRGDFPVPQCVVSLEAWNPFSRNVPECFFTAERDASGVQAECSSGCLQGLEALCFLLKFILFLLKLDHRWI